MGWYRSRGWNANAAAAIALAKGRCARCKKRHPRLEAHHIADPFPARSIELLLRLDNVEVICALCHRRQHAPGVETTCETCGTKVRHNPAQTKRRFCSIACRDKHPDFARMADRVCAGCRKTYTPTRREQTYCGRACAAKATGEKKRRVHR
jgi:hypothetical protein